MEKLVKTCRSALFLFLFVVFTKLFLDVLQQDSLERSAFSIFLKAFLLLVVITFISLFLNFCSILPLSGNDTAAISFRFFWCCFSAFRCILPISLSLYRNMTFPPCMTVRSNGSIPVPLQVFTIIITTIRIIWDL